MPIYEYACNKCKHEFEELVYGDEIPACPKCGSNKTQKLMSCCAFNSGGSDSYDNYSPPPSSHSGGCGCGSCSGGNCASCSH